MISDIFLLNFLRDLENLAEIMPLILGTMNEILNILSILPPSL